jgi:hypothetical protein
MKISQHAKELLVDLDLYAAPVDPKEVCRKLKITYVIEFYANKYNWDYYGNIIDDAEEKENEYVEDEEGEEDEEDTKRREDARYGRRAREFLEIWETKK